MINDTSYTSVQSFFIDCTYIYYHLLNLDVTVLFMLEFYPITQNISKYLQASLLILDLHSIKVHRRTIDPVREMHIMAVGLLMV